MLSDNCLEHHQQHLIWACMFACLGMFLMLHSVVGTCTLLSSDKIHTDILFVSQKHYCKHGAYFLSFFNHFVLCTRPMVRINIRTVFLSIGISIIKIRLSWDRVFIMRRSILVIHLDINPPPPRLQIFMITCPAERLLMTGNDSSFDLNNLNESPK